MVTERAEAIAEVTANSVLFGGREYLRVTAVLEAVGLVDYSRVPEDHLALAQWRGSAVHQACMYDDQGDLDEPSVEPEHLPRLYAWRRCKADLGLQIVATEHRLYCDSPLPFCGQPDRVGFIGCDSAVVDLKTCRIQPSVKWQLAAYASLLSHHGTTVPRRFAVELRADGTYGIEEFRLIEYFRDKAVFNAALQVCWARKEIGLL